MSTLDDKTILLGITGGIAAYKSADLCRRFIKAGARVQVVMSRAACEFITPLTMETLSGRPVHVEMFARRGPGVAHIELSDEADVFVVAPATADFMARAAAGRASDLISAVMLAYRGPVLAAPAMNTNMWENPATRANLATLGERHGWRFVQPGSGELACGWTGPGRMAEPEEIVAAAEGMFPADLEGRVVMVTSGPTVEDIDPVRFIANRSTGKMGHAVARAASRRGARVVLVSGPVALEPPAGVEHVPVRSAREMEAEVNARADTCDAVVMAAAISDFRPAERSESKLKKGDEERERQLKLVRNSDILAGLGEKFEGASRPVLVGFALETEELERNARAKLERKGADLIVANLAEHGFGGDDNEALILGGEGDAALETGRVTKAELADRLLDLVVARLEKA